MEHDTGFGSLFVLILLPCVASWLIGSLAGAWHVRRTSMAKGAGHAKPRSHTYSGQTEAVRAKHSLDSNFTVTPDTFDRNRKSRARRTYMREVEAAQAQRDCGFAHDPIAETVLARYRRAVKRLQPSDEWHADKPVSYLDLPRLTDVAPMSLDRLIIQSERSRDARQSERQIVSANSWML